VLVRYPSRAVFLEMLGSAGMPPPISNGKTSCGHVIFASRKPSANSEPKPQPGVDIHHRRRRVAILLRQRVIERSGTGALTRHSDDGRSHERISIAWSFVISITITKAVIGACTTPANSRPCEQHDQPPRVDVKTSRVRAMPPRRRWRGEQTPECHNTGKSTSPAFERSEKPTRWLVPCTHRAPV